MPNPSQALNRVPSAKPAPNTKSGSGHFPRQSGRHRRKPQAVPHGAVRPCVRRGRPNAQRVVDVSGAQHRHAHRVRPGHARPDDARHQPRRLRRAGDHRRLRSAELHVHARRHAALRHHHRAHASAGAKQFVTCADLAAFPAGESHVYDSFTDPILTTFKKRGRSRTSATSRRQARRWRTSCSNRGITSASSSRS